MAAATSQSSTSPAMPAKARPTTFATTSCCASHSRSGGWPAPSPRPCRALANRPAPQKPRQKAERAEQGVAPLPRLEREVGAGVAVDLPNDVVGPIRKGEAGLGKAGDGQELPLDAPGQPTGRHSPAQRARGLQR